MQINDKFTIKGILELTMTDAVTGALVHHFVDRNTITYNARSMVNYACAGERTIDPINFIAVGNGGYLPGPIDGNTNPPAPDEEDVTLKLELYRKPVFKPINHSTILSSIYEIELGPTELTNNQITECGLFTVGNMLYARRTFKPVSKIANMILNIKWTLLF